MRDRLDGRAGRWARVAARVAVTPDCVRLRRRDPDVRRARLFDQRCGGAARTRRLDAPASRSTRRPPRRSPGPAACSTCRASAWRARPPCSRARSARTAPDPRQPLVRSSGRRPVISRDGIIVVEHTLATTQTTPGAADAFELATSIAPVDAARRARNRHARAGRQISSASGARAAASSSRPISSTAALAEARARWRATRRGGRTAVVALTLLLCTAPVLDAPAARARTALAVRDRRSSSLAVLVAARSGPSALAARDVSARRGRHRPSASCSLALDAVAWSALALDLVEPRRLARPRCQWRLLAAVARIDLSVTSSPACRCGRYVAVYEHALRRGRREHVSRRASFLAAPARAPRAWPLLSHSSCSMRRRSGRPPP